MYATPEDVATRLGRELTPIEGGTVEFLLASATELLLQEIGGAHLDLPWVVDYLEDPAPDPPAAVRAVCTEIAYRAFTNPEAAAAMSAGDLSVSYRAKAEEALYVTRREKRTVRRAAGVYGFRSVTLESPYSGTSDDVLDLLGP